jgi:uncharacterized protein
VAGELLYLDSSAIVKLVLVEAESEALREALAQHPQRVSSALAAVEVRRAVRRVSILPAVQQRVEDILAGIDLLRMEDPILAVAGALDPPLLRSLDALHLAAALSVADELAGFVAYDPRLANAARDAGLAVLTPGT